MYCYIFGAMPVKDFSFEIKENDLVIAADSGLNNTEKFDIKPDYIVGDFDSLGYTPKTDNTVIHPIEKDDTDTMLAIKLGMEKGYQNFRIFGCLGGRLDHTIANIQAASYISEMNCRSVFYGDSENFTVIKNSYLRFNETAKGNISVFALDECNGVNIKNLFYQLKNGSLTPNFPLGTSNKFINLPAEISVKTGKLLIIWENYPVNHKIGGENE